MILERKMIKRYAFKLLVEAGLFDDFDDDQTEALIPYYLSPEQKQELISRYDRMGVPYVVQSHPDDQPNPDDVMNPPRSNRQIRRDVLSTADELEFKAAQKDHEEMKRRYETFNSDPSEKTMPVSRMKRLDHLEKAESTFNTGVIDDYADYSYSDYSDPQGKDALFHQRLADDEESEESSVEPTFNFDLFTKDDKEDMSMPYINLDKEGDDLRESMMSRGALIRKKYYGRY